MSRRHLTSLIISTSRIVSIAFAFLLSAEISLLRGVLNGYSIGTAVSGIPNYPFAGNLFATHGMTLYDELISVYSYIPWLLLIFVISRIRPTTILWQMFSLVPAVLVTVCLIWTHKIISTNSIDTAPYFDLMRQLRAFELECYVFSIGIIIVQIASISLMYSYQRRSSDGRNLA